MPSRKSVCNRFGDLLTPGFRVNVVRVNDPARYVGTIKRIETHSAMARAYGPQVFFSDLPFVVDADSCTRLDETFAVVRNGQVLGWGLSYTDCCKRANGDRAVWGESQIMRDEEMLRDPALAAQVERDPT